MLLLSLLSANVRVWAIFIACVAGNPRFFWWFELVPMTAILVIGLVWHRLVERRLIRSFGQPADRIRPLFNPPTGNDIQ